MRLVNESTGAIASYGVARLLVVIYILTESTKKEKKKQKKKETTTTNLFFLEECVDKREHLILLLAFTKIATLPDILRCRSMAGRNTSPK